MKMFGIAAVLLIVTLHVSADEIAYISDGSHLSEICVSAVHSVDEARQLAKEAGLSRADWHNLQCNGVALKKFVKMRPTTEARPTFFALKPGDESATTELCVAAIESPGKFDEIKAVHFGKHVDIVNALHCNGEPLEVFVRKYFDKNVLQSVVVPQ